MKTRIAPLFAILFSLTVFLAGCETEAPATTNLATGTTQTDSYSNTQETMEEPTTTSQLTEAAQAQLAAPQAGDKIAVIETEKGTIKFKLFTDQVPEMSKNFEELANAGNYNGTPFHRVMQDFMIQTGDFTNKNGTGGYSYKGEGTVLPDEIVPELKHLYGTVSMANRGPNTNGSQFFIVTNENGTAFLDGSYTVFGQVFEGMDVAEAIEALEIPGTERPSETVTMTDVKVMDYQPE